MDGPLVTAMKSGHMFLADEISLADDSVLERLNSVLEPERTLLLAEKSSHQECCEKVVAHENFCFVATMNPGGDYGKKEVGGVLTLVTLCNRITAYDFVCYVCSSHLRYEIGSPKSGARHQRPMKMSLKS